MSSTTTTTTTTSRVSGAVSHEAAQRRNWSHLIDYDLHHSNTPSKASNSEQIDDTVPSPQSTQPEPSALSRVLETPSEWPDDHRRIPAYRPVNRELDQSQRRVYSSNAERVFLTLMFSGLQTNVVGVSMIYSRRGSRFALRVRLTIVPKVLRADMTALAANSSGMDRYIREDMRLVGV